MRKKTWASLCALLVISLHAAAARSELVAGWDFSPYALAGALSIDGATLTGTLDANYSSFDPTFNAGAEAAAFGTLYYDGQFGSTAIALTGLGDEPFLPTTLSLAANLDAPVQMPGDNPFDSHTILVSEGQGFANFLSMLATDAVSVVFEADLSSAAATGSGWTVSFGAKTLSGGGATIGIDFSTDGSGYTVVDTVDVGAVEEVISVPLGSARSQAAFVRLRIAPGDGLPVIDNVAITVPEAGAVARGLAAGVALLAAGWRRRG